MRRFVLAAATSLLMACGAASHRAAAPEAAPKAPLGWAPFDDSTFARAKAERRFIVMDGAAEWCHFCHVMEATTYHDPNVAAVLRQHFIAAKVDVDSRPDIEERYQSWGWPATVIFSPDGVELGKYRGYIPPDEFVEILNGVVRGAGTRPEAEREEKEIPRTPLGEETLAWATRLAELELEDYWDAKEGGWGHEPKVPIHIDTEYALRRAKVGDAKLREHALTVLEKQRSIIDPVWGGIYQYSVAPDWVHPHFEKLMSFNAGALDNYATAYALTKDARWLGLARDIDRYLRAFMLAPSGAFHGTQDADLNAHEPGKRFVDGHRFYALGDKERRALGIPRVDPHEYAKDSGQAIAAYATLYEVARDASALDVAQRAAARILATHAVPTGGVKHDAASSGPLHLADNAAFAFGLFRLYEVTKDARHLEAAKRIVGFVLSELADARGGGFFAHTEDPAAVGVFQQRRKPFAENVLFLRVLCRLAKAAPDPAYTRALDQGLRAMVDPDRIKEQGKFIGDLLSLLDERGH
jgi:uncharacterized protein YyaL (SSP411 family)